MFKLTSKHQFETLIVGVSIAAVAVTPLIAAKPNPAIAQNASFPDTSDHWAQPFIAKLAERNIVTGYPDNTYRPNQPVDRDEFAAIIRDAFNQSKERRISSASAFKDVPQGYWASAAIEEAYETGFLSGYPGGYFRPRQPVTKVEAISSLARNLKLQQAAQSPQQATTVTPAEQAQRPQARRRGFMFPIASTMLLAPLIRPVAAVANTPPNNATSAVPDATKNNAQPSPQSPSALVNQYYQDANRIPDYAINEVAAATKAGIVVNHPNVRVLNPTQPATRGEMAALIYQALVSQNRAEPIANQNASQYIAGQR